MTTEYDDGSIDDLGLSTRTRNALRHHRYWGQGLKSIDQLRKQSDYTLLGCPDIGPVTLNEIRRKLAEWDAKQKPAPRKPKLRPPVFDRGEWPADEFGPPSRQACWSCRFWKHNVECDVPDEGIRAGNCRRVPPIAYGISIGMHTLSGEGVDDDPYTNATHWCGEWKER